MNSMNEVNYLNPFLGPVPSGLKGITNKRHVYATPQRELDALEERWSNKKGTAKRFIDQLDDAHPRLPVTQLDFIMAGLLTTLNFGVDADVSRYHGATDYIKPVFTSVLSRLTDQDAVKQLYREVLEKLGAKLEKDKDFLRKVTRFKFSDEPEGNLTKLAPGIQVKLEEILKEWRDERDIDNLTAGFRLQSAKEEIQGGQLIQKIRTAAVTNPIQPYEKMTVGVDRIILKANEELLVDRQNFLRNLVAHHGIQPDTLRR